MSECCAKDFGCFVTTFSKVQVPVRVFCAVINIPDYRYKVLLSLPQTFPISIDSCSVKKSLFAVVQERDENFPLCLQFAQSNFRYHRFLDVDSHRVTKQLEG